MRSKDFERMDELVDRIDNEELRELMELLIEWISEKESIPEDY